MYFDKLGLRIKVNVLSQASPGSGLTHPQRGGASEIHLHLEERYPSPFRNSIDRPLTINRMCGRIESVPGLYKWVANWSPHLLIISESRSLTVLPCGTDNSNSLWPQIFFNSMMV